MKAEELRIGNYVELSILQNNGDFKYELIRVIANCIKDAERYGDDWCARPIPLTEEWLMKFGFVPIDERGYSKEVVNKEDNYEYNFVLSKLAYGYDNDVCLYVIQYIHQLQNLYFALTGEELTIQDR
jgi:hypothetical protein